MLDIGDFDEEIIKEAEIIWDRVGEKYKEREVSSKELKVILIDEMDLDINEKDKEKLIALFNLVDEVFRELYMYNNKEKGNKFMYG